MYWIMCYNPSMIYQVWSLWIYGVSANTPGLSWGSGIVVDVLDCSFSSFPFSGTLKSVKVVNARTKHKLMCQCWVRLWECVETRQYSDVVCELFLIRKAEKLRKQSTEEILSTNASNVNAYLLFAPMTLIYSLIKENVMMKYVFSCLFGLDQKWCLDFNNPPDSYQDVPISSEKTHLVRPVMDW